MNQSTTRFWVWFDPLLEEYFYIEPCPQAKILLDALAQEKVKPREIMAETPSQALEKAFPDRHRAHGVSARVH